MRAPAGVKRLRSAAALIALLCTCHGVRIAAAQRGTVLVTGIVTTKTGTPVQAATVALESPGVRLERSTRANGRFEIPNVVPGEYTFSITREGFAPLHETRKIPPRAGLRFILTPAAAHPASAAAPTGEVAFIVTVLDEDQRPVADVSVELKPTVDRTAIPRSNHTDAAGTAVISVPRDWNPIDARLTKDGKTVVAERNKRDNQLVVVFAVAAQPPEGRQQIPTQRKSSWDDLMTVPGVTMTGVMGQKNRWNLFYTDGAEIAPAFSIGITTKTPVAPITTFFGRAIPIDSGDSRALEPLGMMSVTGSNRWRVEGAYRNINDLLTSAPVRLDCKCVEGNTGFHRSQLHDVETDVGGPIVRNHLGALGGVQYRRNDVSQPGTSSSQPATSERVLLFERVSWDISSGIRISHSVSDVRWKQSDVPTVANPFSTLSTYEGHRPSIVYGEVSHVATPSTYWQASAKGASALQNRAKANDGSMPWRHDITTGVSAGGSYQVGAFSAAQTSVNGSLTHFEPALFGANHQFKLNGQFQRSSEQARWGYPGGAHLYDDLGTRSFAYTRTTALIGSDVSLAGASIDDEIKIGDQVTVHGGGLFNHVTVGSNDLEDVDIDGNETGAVVKGRGDLARWNLFGAVGELKIAFNGAREVIGIVVRHDHPAVDLHPFAAFHPGNSALTLAAFDHAAGQYSRVIATIDPARNFIIDPEIEVPSVNTIETNASWKMFSVDVSVTYSRRTSEQLIGWRDIGGAYGASTLTLTNGRDVTIHPLLTSPSARMFQLSNPSGWGITSQAMNLTVTKRWSSNAVRTSYTLSRARGLSAATEFKTGLEPVDDLVTRFGQDPNDLTNADGLSPDDLTHVASAVGSYTVPSVLVRITASLQYATGRPFTEFVTVPLPQGTQAVLVSPLGQHRFSSQTMLDLQFSRSFRPAGNGRFELFASVLNALNSTAETDAFTGNVRAAQFGQPSRFVEPRQAMLGIKIVR